MFDLKITLYEKMEICFKHDLQVVGFEMVWKNLRWTCKQIRKILVGLYKAIWKLAANKSQHSLLAREEEWLAYSVAALFISTSTFVQCCIALLVR